jgi:hypothetical protein
MHWDVDIRHLILSDMVYVAVGPCQSIYLSCRYGAGHDESQGCQGAVCDVGACPLQSIDISMHILHTAEKGRLLNIIDHFYIHRETTANNPVERENYHQV